jgi:hypothetical protein
MNITVDAVLIGAVVSIVFEATKLFPAHWLVKIFGKAEKTQKLRKRAVVFLITAIAVFATGMASGAFLGGDWYNLGYMLIVALTASYTTYQTVVRMVSDKFPEEFKTK